MAQAGVQISSMDRIDGVAARSRAISARSESYWQSGVGQGLGGVRYQAGAAQCGDAEPSDVLVGLRNVEEIVAPNPVAAIEVVSHRGVSCVCRMRLPGQAARVVSATLAAAFCGNREPGWNPNLSVTAVRTKSRGK